MFARRFFAGTYYPSRYFPAGGEPVVLGDTLVYVTPLSITDPVTSASTPPLTITRSGGRA